MQAKKRYARELTPSHHPHSSHQTMSEGGSLISQGGTLEFLMGLSPRCPQWYWFDNTPFSSLSYFPTFLLVAYRITSQINYPHSNPCLRSTSGETRLLAFWGALGLLTRNMQSCPAVGIKRSFSSPQQGLLDVQSPACLPITGTGDTAHIDTLTLWPFWPWPPSHQEKASVWMQTGAEPGVSLESEWVPQGAFCWASGFHNLPMSNFRI